MWGFALRRAGEVAVGPCVGVGSRGKGTIAAIRGREAGKQWGKAKLLCAECRCQCDTVAGIQRGNIVIVFFEVVYIGKTSQTPGHTFFLF